MNVVPFAEPGFSSELLALGIILAYIGPGAGLAAFGSLLTVLGAGVLMAVGLVWYPVRQVLRTLRARRMKEPSASENDSDKQGKAADYGA